MLIFARSRLKTFGRHAPDGSPCRGLYLYAPAVELCYPFVGATNLLANACCELFGVPKQQDSNSLSSEEMRTSGGGRRD